MISVETQALCREIQAIMSIYAGVVVGGMGMGYSAIAVPDIQSEVYSNTSLFSPIQTNDEELSWFASSINLGQIGGALIGGVSGTKYGPKLTIILASIPIILGWVLVSVSTNIYLLIAGRVLKGIGGSTVTANCTLLVAQYSSQSRRGPFLSLFPLMIGLGILASYIAGLLLTWRLVPVIPVCFMLMCAIALSQVPESPIWLLGHKGEHETEVALKWLRGKPDVSKEIQELKLTQENQNEKLTLVQAIKNLKKPGVYKPVLLVMVNMILVMSMGPFSVVFYAVTIFQSSGISIDNYLAAIIIAVVRLIGGVLAIFLIKNFARVKVGIVTMTLMIISMVGLGACFYCKEQNIDFPGLSIIPLICLLLYMLAFGAGVGPLQWVWSGELMPPEYKVLNGGIVSVVTFTLFLNTKLFPNLLVWIQPYGTYWLFAASGLVALIMYCTVFPESKGKSMVEIKQMFAAKDKNIPKSDSIEC